MNEYLGHEVLVRLYGSKAPDETVIERISPNRLFVKLGGPRASHEAIGWVSVDDVEIVADLGSLRMLYGV